MKPTLLLFLILIPWAAGAAEVRLTVAVPDAGGRVSLGVFDAAGRLIRVLADRWEVADFRVELNGIGVDWDGIKDDGTPAANGEYLVRGWFIPETVIVEGDAYYFNDWTVDEGGAPRRTRCMVLLEKGFVLIDGDGGVWVSEGSNVLAGPQFLPSSDVVAADDKRILLGADMYEWSPGGEAFLGAHRTISPPAQAAAFHAGWLAAVRPDAIEILPVSADSKPRTIDVSAKLVSWCGERVVWSDGNQLAIEDQVALPTDMVVQSLAPGPGDTFWVAGLLAKDPVVRQCSSDGSVLREFRPDGQPGKVHVFSSAYSLSILVILETAGSQRVMGLRPSEAIEDSRPIADWDVYVDVMTQDVSDFGFVDGKPVPSGGGKSKLVSLAASGMGSGGVALKVDVQDEGGIVWVKSTDGLRLLAVAEGSSRVVFEKIQGGLQILVGRAARVEGFLVKGLERVVALEGGSVAWSQ